MEFSVQRSCPACKGLMFNLHNMQTRSQAEYKAEVNIFKIRESPLGSGCPLSDFSSERTGSSQGEQKSTSVG